MKDIIAKPAPQAAPRRTEPLSWIQAYLMFLRNSQESFGLKILPLALIGLVPIALADDVLLPFLGMADNIPTSLLTIFVIWRTWLRVKTYRYQTSTR